eukprot:9450384-Pyramimonas_sp.AAC.1
MVGWTSLGCTHTASLSKKVSIARIPPDKAWRESPKRAQTEPKQGPERAPEEFKERHKRSPASHQAHGSAQQGLCPALL